MRGRPKRELAREYETLCWRCNRPGTNTCSWDASLKPVEGWDAEVRQWCGGDVSWHVYSCPLFDEMRSFDDREKNSPRVEECPFFFVPERMAYLFRYGWKDKAISQEFGLTVGTIQKYRTKWRKNREAKGE